MRLIEIYKAGGLIEAESLRAALLDVGINCQLDGGPRVGMPGLASGWNMAPVGVVVAEADIERARPVVNEWCTSLDLPLPQWLPTPSPPPKRVFQFSLKTIFVLMSMEAIFCALAVLVGKQLMWAAVQFGEFGRGGPAISIFAAALLVLMPANLLIYAKLRKERRKTPDREQDA